MLVCTWRGRKSLLVPSFNVPSRLPSYISQTQLPGTDGHRGRCKRVDSTSLRMPHPGTVRELSFQHREEGPRHHQGRSGGGKCINRWGLGCLILERSLGRAVIESSQHLTDRSSRTQVRGTSEARNALRCMILKKSTFQVTQPAPLFLCRITPANRPPK